MKNYIALLIFLILFSCKSKTEKVKDDKATTTEPTQVPVTDELHDSDYGIFHFSWTVNRSLPEYALEFHLPDKKFYLYNNSAEEGIPIQEIPFSEDINYEEGYFAENPDATISFMDYNFDGYKDISILSVAGTANSLSDIYLFDPSFKNFVENKELSELTSLQVDSVNQLLKFHNAGGMGGGWYTAGLIQWRNRKPSIIRKEEQTSSEEAPETFIRSIQLLQGDGQMRTVSKVQIQRLGDNKEKQCLLEGDWIEFDKYPNLIFTELNDNVVKVDGRSGSCN